MARGTAPDPDIRATQYDADNQRTEAERFAIAARAITRRHGGRPTASLENGRIVFTYPNGVKTNGGERV